MGNLVTTEANALLQSSVAGTAYTAPTTPIKLALVTVIGTATTAGTEVTGGSYARQTITWGTAASGSIANATSAITFTGMPGPITIVGIDIWDSVPTRRWFGVLGTSGSPVTKSVNAGDTVTFAIGSLSIALS